MFFKFVIKRRGDASDSPPLAEHLFDEPIISIGSDPAATIHLKGAGVAPEHAIVLLEDAAPLLISRAETTILNGETLAREARRPLSVGDQIGIAEFLLTVTSPAAVTQPLTPPTQTFQPQQATATEPLAADSDSPPNADGAPGKTKNFAAILDSLRTEEDSFYFHLEGGAQSGGRVIVNEAEMPCGWDATGTRVTCDPLSIAANRMVVRKDWTGVVIHALAPGMVQVNGEPTVDPRRLRNNDRVQLSPPADAPEGTHASMVFHEPASLVALDSILPQPLPPPVPLATASAAATTDNATSAAAPAAAKKGARFNFDRRYFGYFTLPELGIMAVGTIITAVIVFLIMEYA